MEEGEIVTICFTLSYPPPPQHTHTAPLSVKKLNRARESDYNFLKFGVLRKLIENESKIDNHGRDITIGMKGTTLDHV